MITGTYKIVNDYKDLQRISGNLVAYYNERAREGYKTNVCFFWAGDKQESIQVLFCFVQYSTEHMRTVVRFTLYI